VKSIFHKGKAYSVTLTWLERSGARKLKISSVENMYEVLTAIYTSMHIFCARQDGKSKSCAVGGCFSLAVGLIDAFLACVVTVVILSVGPLILPQTYQ